MNVAVFIVGEPERHNIRLRHRVQIGRSKTIQLRPGGWEEPGVQTHLTAHRSRVWDANLAKPGRPREVVDAPQLNPAKTGH